MAPVKLDLGAHELAQAEAGYSNVFFDIHGINKSTHIGWQGLDSFMFEAAARGLNGSDSVLYRVSSYTATGPH